jgi:nucleoside-diphosphate-sugar epimerase
MSGYADGPVPGPPDVVIHFAGTYCTHNNSNKSNRLIFIAYARNMLVPDSELFQANVRSTYNVVEAACKLGVKKIIIASSETTYGVCFAQGDAEYHSFPLEEDYDVDPEDSYGHFSISHDFTN